MTVGELVARLFAGSVASDPWRSQDDEHGVYERPLLSGGWLTFGVACGVLFGSFVIGYLAMWLVDALS